MNDFIHKYVNGYELRGDEGDYTPTEQERFLIEDCIRGLIEDPEFIASQEQEISRLKGEIERLNNLNKRITEEHLEQKKTWERDWNGIRAELSSAQEVNRIAGLDLNEMRKEVDRLKAEGK